MSCGDVRNAPRKARSVVELNLENIDVFVVTNFHHIQPKIILHVRIVRVKVFDFTYSSTDGNRGKSLRYSISRKENTHTHTNTDADASTNTQITIRSPENV